MTQMHRRSTVYIDPTLHKALRMKAVEQDRSVSHLVNEAIRFSLSEDEIDIRAVEQRRREPSRPFAAFLKDLKRHDKI